MTTYNEIHSKLVKIAQDQLDTANGQAQGSAGPQEVVDALVQVIDELQSVADAIPAQPTNNEQAPPGDASPSAGEEPPAEEDEKRRPMGAKVDEKDLKINELTAKVEVLNSHIAKEQLAKVAEEYARVLSNDTRKQQAKFDEIVKSDKPADYWSARLEAINEFTETNNVSTQFAKPAKTESFYRVAKQSNNLRELML